MDHGGLYTQDQESVGLLSSLCICASSLNFVTSCLFFGKTVNKAPWRTILDYWNIAIW